MKPLLTGRNGNIDRSGIQEDQMSKKQAHPEIQLFDYLNGSVGQEAATVIEAHLSECDDCASLAGLVRELKESSSEPNNEGQLQFSDLNSQISRGHPDIGKLASFFYSESRHAESSSVAGHLAHCTSCAEAIAVKMIGVTTANNAVLNRFFILLIAP